MLQAMNTGHEGSLTTIHANSPRDALSRLETLVLTAGVDLPLRAIREQISSAFDLLIQISRLVDGSRRITNITEVLRMESEVITLQDIFLAKPPEEDTPAAGRTLTLLTPLGLHGPQAALPREDGGVGREPAAELLRAGGRHRGPADIRGGVRPMNWKRKRIRIRVGAALGAAVLAAVPAADASIRVSAVDATSYPRVRLTIVTSKPSAKAPLLKENGQAVSGLPLRDAGARQEHRARRRPVEVDAREAVRRRGCGGAGLPPRQAAERPGRGRDLRDGTRSC